VESEREKAGERCIFVVAALRGLFPIVVVLSLNLLPPLVSLGVSTLITAVFYAVLLTVKKTWNDVVHPLAAKDVVIGSLIVGVMVYILYYNALKLTSPGNASIISLTEIFFGYLLFNVWKKDDLPVKHLFGALLIILGAVIILGRSLTNLNFGDVMILMMASLSPIGNYFFKKARAVVSTESILFTRNLLTSIIVLALAVALHTKFSVKDIGQSIWFLLFNGLVMFGLNINLWLEGIHRISVTKANVMASTAPLITLLLAWLILRHQPTVWQLLAFVPIFWGVSLLALKPASIQGKKK
jgi:drug/metabolite transporter (DMT)-like permease